MAYTELNEHYKVCINLKRGEETYSFDSLVSFAYDPDDYGNGYCMYIKSKEEPFGGQSYDLRYNRDFQHDYLIEFIALFYSRRFDGKKTDYDTKWKLTGISITELKEE